jgi:hypothetical protein
MVAPSRPIFDLRMQRIHGGAGRRIRFFAGLDEENTPPDKLEIVGAGGLAPKPVVLLASLIPGA